MDDFFTPETLPAPVAYVPTQKKDYSNCTYLCFSTNLDDIDINNFNIKSNYPNLNLQKEKIKNVFIFCVYSEGILGAALKLFTSIYYFNIYYESKKLKIYEISPEFTVEKGKTKFIFDAGNKGFKRVNVFKNPTCLEQYKAFCSLSKNKKKIFQDTKDFLTSNLDFELFLYLLNNEKDKKEELVNIFSYFPNFKIKYNMKQSLPQIDFGQITNDKNYKILKLTYSIIQDSTELLVDLKEEDVYCFINYNKIQKNAPLIIRKNIFDFVISKFDQEFIIKNLCKSTYSIPLLFDYLIDLKPENLKKIKNLRIDDIPNKYPIEDDLINLIEKYEKIKEAFNYGEIEEILKKYLNLSYDKKKITQLEEIVDKLSSIKDEVYVNIIKQIKYEIVQKGKQYIKGNRIQSLDMCKFINKYKNFGNFYSDEKLIEHIGKNINLTELNINENTLNEFNKCNFFNMINFQLIPKYISGVLSNVNNFHKFSLFFKYIYILDEKEKENKEKNTIYLNLILAHFKYLLTTKFILDDEFKSIIQKIIILSINYIPLEQEKKNNFKDIIKNILKIDSHSRDSLFDMLIDAIINPNLEIYISNEEKEKVCEFIIEKFYFNLGVEKKVDFLLKIKSCDIREKLIFTNNEYFPSLKFSYLLKKDDNIFFSNMNYFIKKGLLKNDEFLKGDYFKKLITECNSIRDRLDKKEINFKDLNKIKELINKNKFSSRIFYICLGETKISDELLEKVKAYTEKYIYYCEQLDTLITYYNKYYPNSKKEEINKYSMQQTNFKEAKIYICNIEINEQIYDEIKLFQKFEKSKLFCLIYNNLKNENDEITKYNRAIEIFSELEKLFNGKDFELDFLEVPLNKLEHNEKNENLLNEIKYLKENFKYNNSDENQIVDYLLFYKNRIKISFALKSLKIICEKLSVENVVKLEIDIEKLANDIAKIKNYLIISKHIKSLKELDEYFLDKNFIEVLNNLYQNEQLITFLNNQKESETRDLIDGLFDDENEDNIAIELKDIEILINVVCFFQELKSKTQNINVFLNNFHSILNEKNHLYKDIVSNIAHIKEKLNLLQDFVKIQLGKKYKFSTNIKNFIENGIIKFIKMKKEKNFDTLFREILEGKGLEDILSNIKEEIYFNAIIKIDDKEENFEMFMETIKKIKAKNAYKYGKNKEYLLKTQKIA